MIQASSLSYAKNYIKKKLKLILPCSLCKRRPDNNSQYVERRWKSVKAEQSCCCWSYSTSIGKLSWPCFQYYQQLAWPWPKTCCLLTLEKLLWLIFFKPYQNIRNGSLSVCIHGHFDLSHLFFKIRRLHSCVQLLLFLVDDLIFLLLKCWWCQIIENQLKW